MQCVRKPGTRAATRERAPGDPDCVVERCRRPYECEYKQNPAAKPHGCTDGALRPPAGVPTSADKTYGGEEQQQKQKKGKATQRKLFFVHRLHSFPAFCEFLQKNNTIPHLPSYCSMGALQSQAGERKYHTLFTIRFFCEKSNGVGKPRRTGKEEKSGGTAEPKRGREPAPRIPPGAPPRPGWGNLRTEKGGRHGAPLEGYSFPMPNSVRNRSQISANSP